MRDDQVVSVAQSGLELTGRNVSRDRETEEGEKRGAGIQSASE